MSDASWGDIEAKVARIIEGPAFKRELVTLTKGVAAAADLVSARTELRRMAKPATVADRLKALKSAIEAESDKLLADIDAIEQTTMPAAFAKGRAFLDQQKADVAGLEAELSQLTNLPLGS